jgi:hypothetical protein
MGQQANSGRRATLDEKKSRAAGRRNESGRAAIRDGMGDEQFAKGKTGGAGKGRASVGKRSGRGAGGQGGGGGGGGPAQAKDAAWAGKVVTRKSSRPARKRG